MASPSATPTPTPTPQPVSITVTMTGELLWHSTDYMQGSTDAHGKGFDFSQVFAGVKPLIEGSDLAICHEEVPFAPPGGPYSSYPVFAAPREVAANMKALGFDACTTASNHSIDQGYAGLERTVAAFHEAGIKTTGTFTSAEEAATPLILDVKGVKVALIEGAYSTNGIPLPAGKEWSVGNLDPDRLLGLAKKARSQGADVVIAVMHAGDEYVTLPNGQQKELAQILTASPDVDFVYGHHIHHVQPFDKVNGKWVLYGLGNLIADGIDDGTQENNIAIATFTGVPGSGKFTTTKVQYAPVLVTSGMVGPVRVYWAQSGLDHPGSTPATTPARLTQTIARNKKTVELLGVTEAEQI